jgi:hypothetical protein
MKRLAGLVVAFALLVTGIESIKILVAWWQAGRPPPGLAELLAFAALALVGVVWWRHSVFACGKGVCLLPQQERGQEASNSDKPR